MNQFQGLVLLSLTLAVTSCRTSNRKRVPEFRDEYSLEEKSAPKRENLSFVDHTIKGEWSLPLFIHIARGPKENTPLPPKATAKNKSQVEISYGKCSFTLATGPAQVDRYLRTNQWIKMQQALKPHHEIFLARKQEIYLRLAADVLPVIGKNDYQNCRKELSGKKVLLGKIHFNRSKLGLSALYGSPNWSFNRKSGEALPKNVFLSWPRAKPQPQLQDEFEIPFTHYSPIFGTKFLTAGNYAVTIEPVLSFKPLHKTQLKTKKASKSK